MRPAPKQPSWKTSVLLTAATRARYEASGRPLSALIEKGLDAFEAEALGAERGPDPINLIMPGIERLLRASLNEHGMIAWPGLPERTPDDLMPQPRTGPVRMRRVGRPPTRRYVPRDREPGDGRHRDRDE
jgi:hypothetical protein